MDTTKETRGATCALCGRPGDGERYVGARGETFAACCARHAMAYQRRAARRARGEGRAHGRERDRQIEAAYEQACEYRWASEALYELWEEIAAGERDRGEPDVSWSLSRRRGEQLERLDGALHVLCEVLDLDPIEDWSREEIRELAEAISASQQARDDDKASCAQRPSP